jgi:hypothetical protein
MSTLHETHDEIVSRVTDEQRVLHGGVSDGVEYLGRKELEAVGLALAVGVVVALAVGVPLNWSVVMSVFIGFAGAIGTFLVASIVLVERDDGRVNEQAHHEEEHPSHLGAHPGASAGAISRWTDDGGSTLDDLEVVARSAEPVVNSLRRPR